MMHRWGQVKREKEDSGLPRTCSLAGKWEPNLARQFLACRQCRIRANMKTGIHALQIKHICFANVINLDSVTIRGK